MPSAKMISQLSRRVAHTVSSCALYMMAATLTLASAPGTGHAGEPVYVALRSTVTTSHDPILLGDVADVLTRDSSFKQHLARVDVADGPEVGSSVEVTKKQIELRLRLAGLEPDRFRVIGASKARVQSATVAQQSTPVEQARLLGPTGTPWDQIVLQELVTELSDLWQVPPDRIRATLLKALPVSKQIDAASVDSIEVVVSALQKPGNMRPRVSLFANGVLLDVWNVSAEALLVHDVVIVVNTIQQGQIITSADVTVAKRPLRQSGQLVELNESLGKTARRALEPGHVIQSHDLVDQRVSSQSLIKARDAVRLVVRKGGVVVVLSDGQALQPGNPGDFIRVRNPRSRQVVVGRVTEAGEVSVRL